MYLEHYKLNDFPFQLTPDHRFFFESTEHRKASAHLVFGLSQGEGFIIITGEVGAGKTTLLGHVLDTLDPDTIITGKLVSTHLAGDDMLRSVALAFGLGLEGVDKASLLRGIQNFLEASFVQGKRLLLLVDEAQNITLQALEELRMLSNIQVGNKVPLQSVLLAQPQLRRLLTSPDLEQFRQRVVASYHLGAMTAAETREYIRHRLSVVGWTNDPEFTEEAFPAIYAQTGGLPRKINTFCSRLMMFCYLDDIHCVDGPVVHAVAEDLTKEMGSILDHAPGDGRSAGVMHSPFDIGDGLTMSGKSLHGRLESLERMVERHDRALRKLVLLGDSLRLGGTFD